MLGSMVYIALYVENSKVLEEDVDSWENPSRPAGQLQVFFFTTYALS
jgi:hypothetical protein